MHLYRDLYTLEWNRVKSYQLGSCTNTNLTPEIQDADLMVLNYYIIPEFCNLCQVKCQ